MDAAATVPKGSPLHFQMHDKTPQCGQRKKPRAGAAGGDMKSAEEINSMAPDARASYLDTQRRNAAIDARYTHATSEFKTTQLHGWMAVETRLEREQRQGEEREARIVEHHRNEKLQREREIREERRHELAVARTYAEAASNGNGNNSVDVDWAEVFNSISSALTELVNRVQALEARVTKVESNNAATARSREIATIRADTTASQMHSDVKGDIAGLKSDVNFLRFRLDALNSKKQTAPLEQHIVVHHDGR
jgi:hypothetical protein